MGFERRGGGDTAVDVVAGHLPVMPREVLELLRPAAGETVVDCTAGGGGHLRLLLDAVGDGGRVIALDRDERAFAADAAGGVVAGKANAELVRAAFSDVREVLRARDIDGVDVLFADLGVSSFQLDEAERGFSFLREAPLDMRMDRRSGETARELIDRLDERELADVLFQYGDERKSRRIAHALKRAPAPATTTELADVVRRAVGGPWQRIHPATRSFQALRIAVNGELRELEALLDALPHVLAVGGRAAILSFHSLEDRAVKRRFRSEAYRAAGLAPIVKKPREASDDEVRDNPRARSAKLRAVVRHAAPAAHLAHEHDGDAGDDDDNDDNDNDDAARAGDG